MRNRRSLLVLVAALVVVALPAVGLAAGGAFVDDDMSIFEGDINWLATSGVTAGCNPPTNDQFCPGDNVTRGQMAAFLVRFLGLTDDGSPKSLALKTESSIRPTSLQMRTRSTATTRASSSAATTASRSTTTARSASPTASTPCSHCRISRPAPISSLPKDGSVTTERAVSNSDGAVSSPVLRRISSPQRLLRRTPACRRPGRL